MYNVVTRRGAAHRRAPPRPRGLRAAVLALTAAKRPPVTADNLCSFVEDEATFGKVRGAASPTWGVTASAPRGVLTVSACATGHEADLPPLRDAVLHRAVRQVGERAGHPGPDPGCARRRRAVRGRVRSGKRSRTHARLALCSLR